MKILALCWYIDPDYPIGITPVWWQLLKSLNELGVEIVLGVHDGQTISSLWWRNAGKPFSFGFVRKSVEFFSYKQRMVFVQNPFKHWFKNSYKRYIEKTLSNEKDVDVILVCGIPFHYFSEIPEWVEKKFGIPTIFFEHDMPSILPQYGGWGGATNYVNPDFSEYAAFITTSKGVVPLLTEMGASNVHVIYFAVDPYVYRPTKSEKTIDVLFQGFGSKFREDWMTKMITEPSMCSPLMNFAVAGQQFDTNLGSAKKLGALSFTSFRDICCQSKINLNITRKHFAEVYCSSTSRPFELASLECCMISNPCNGINEWFEVGKEILIVNSAQEAVELYTWLLSSEETRIKMGQLARKRVLKSHSYDHRAKQLLEIMRNVLKKQ
ncbi:MAG: glycosyltransferase [Candidatus Bathyarchaeia archaeon]